MKKKLIIVGTGLFAEVSKEYFNAFSEYEVIGFTCHKDYLEKETIQNLSVFAIEDLQDKFPPEEVHVFVAIGYKNMNKMRESIYLEMCDKGYTCATFIHPNVKIWDSTEIKDNVFIFEDNTIQPFSKIGSNTMLWSGNHVGHHSEIGNNCFISSHVVISGSCKVKDNVFIGVNSTIRDSITIEKETLIGAGALIMKNTKEKEVYAPSPTKTFPKNSEEIGF